MQGGSRIWVVFHCRYFTDSKPLCLGLGDLFKTNTEETNSEIFSFYESANFFLRQNLRGGFFSTATVF